MDGDDQTMTTSWYLRRIIGIPRWDKLTLGHGYVSVVANGDNERFAARRTVRHIAERSRGEDLLHRRVRQAEPTFMLRDWRQIFPRLEVGTLSVEMLSQSTASRTFVATVRFTVRFVLLRWAVFDEVVALETE